MAELVKEAAGYHAVHLTEEPTRALVWEVIAEYLRPWVPQNAHVLEIGARLSIAARNDHPDI